ncbi:hypothetical protein JIG36_36645 [Actinoplanes sp. LDG1-06]|uniref:Uncharacterized protein n=2 Tax=Paractinoplanes ovalisporus TaxID=2810368 RepID=A0ABS2AMF3_9ACTN|nr:hypothetical protein [Actinoplanes ovalisporus]
MSGPQAIPFVATITEDFGRKVREEGGVYPGGPIVGASDAEEDAVHSGARDEQLAVDVTRDSDGVPVGADDVEEDKRRSGV